MLGQEKRPRGFRGAGKLLSQGNEQLVVNAAEAAVAHDENHVVRVHVGHHMGHDVIHILTHVGIGAGGLDVGQQFIFVQPLLGGEALVVLDGGDDGEVSLGQGLGQLALEEVADGGVAAGFEEYPQAAFREALAQAGNGQPDGGTYI